MDSSWIQKVVEKRAPKIDPLWKLLLGALGPIGGHLGPKGGQKGCQKETQRGVQNGAKSRHPEKARKSEFGIVFIMF